MKGRITTFVFSIVTAVAVAQPPANYYSSITTQQCATLKTALSNIISNGFSSKSYDALWNQYLLTDIKPREVGSGSANVIYDIYSDNPTGTDPYNFTPGTKQCGNYKKESDCYNREHSFPKSWFNDASPMYSDYIHLLPTDGYVNNKRSNYIYGEVGSASFTSLNGSKLGTSSFAGVSGTVFEPIDSFKGDVARIYLYMVTRYESKLAQWNGYNTEGAKTLDGTTFPAVEIPYLRLMLKWHYQDPVSQKEIIRNNGAYSFQNNRNPFVDHPEYVDRVWNASCPGLSLLPVDVIDFQAKLSGSKVLLNWSVMNEENLRSYEVQRSFNGKDFEYAGSVAAAKQSRYNYTDNVEAFSGRSLFYRLRKVDFDGQYAYSDVVAVNVPLNVKFSLYPNPARDKVYININNNSNAVVQIGVSDIQGRKVLAQHAKAVNGQIVLQVDQLTPGVYFVTMTVDGSQWMQKLVVDQ